MPSSTSAWHHVAIVFEGSGSTGEFRLYLDGTPIDTVSTDFGTVLAHSDNGAIGGRQVEDVWGNTSSGHYFDGRIDDVTIYNTALTEDQAAALANHHQPIELTADTVVARWAFEPMQDRFTEYTYDGTTQTGKDVFEGDDDTGTLREHHTFSYDDATGRMTSVSINKYDTSRTLISSTTETYTYNDQGLRVTKDDGITVTTYLFDPQNHTGYAQVLEEGVDANGDGLEAGEVHRTYTLGHDVITQANSSLVSTGEAILQLLYDGHGSTRAMVDAVGKVIQRYAYDAYGVQLTGIGLTAAASALTTLLYSGEAFNAATGLQYLRARWYNPSTGRFNRLDPFAGNASDPVSLHKYLYASANPVMGVDPTGMFFGVVVEVALAIGIGNAIHGIYDGTVQAAGTALEATLRGVQAGQTATGILLAGVIGPALAGPLILLGGAIAGKLIGFVAPTLAKATSTFIGRSARTLRRFWAEELGLAKLPTNLEVHHIVEQTITNVLRFSRNAINSIENTIPIPREYHEAVSAAFSSGRNKLAFMNDLPTQFRTLREYIHTLPWEDAYNWGRSVMEYVLEHGEIDEGFEAIAGKLIK